MLNPRRALVTVLVTVLASAVGAPAVASCDRTGDAPRADSVVSAPPVTPPVDSPPPPARSGWDENAGPVLLVAGDRPDAAIVVFPEIQGEHAAVELKLDTAMVRGATATLVTRGGTTSTVTLGERTTPEEEEECVGWPMRRVVPPSGTVASWSIGLVGRARLTPIPLDSVGSLSAADSAALVAEVARLASTLPPRGASARLRGLPFFVQDLRRFRIAPGVDAVVAQVIRRVHQEASPLEERTLLIAERDTARPPDRPGRYTIAFHQRAVGSEETLEGSEVLAALTPQTAPRPMLVLARESEGGVRYSLLERTGPRSWRVKWTSALVRC